MFKTINESITALSRDILESGDEPLHIIEETGVRYVKYLKFRSEALAQKVKDAAAKRDGVDVELDGTNMYFKDEFEFNHIWYHYKAKIQPGAVSVETLEPTAPVSESLNGDDDLGYKVGRFTTTYTIQAFHHVCDHYGFTIERNPSGVGPRTFVAKNAAGETVGNYMDGLGTFYNDKLINPTTDEDFMAGATAPEAAIVDEADDVLNEADDVWVKGDTYQRDGADLWTSGIMVGRHGNAIECHGDGQAKADALRDQVLADHNRDSVSEGMVVASPEKMVKLTPSETQLGKGAEALRGMMTMGGFSSSELRKWCAVVYKAMVGGMPTAPKAVEEGVNAMPTTWDESAPQQATVYVFSTDDCDPIVEECNLPPGRHVLIKKQIDEDMSMPETTVQDTVDALSKLKLRDTLLKFKEKPDGSIWSGYQIPNLQDIEKCRTETVNTLYSLGYMPDGGDDSLMVSDVASVKIFTGGWVFKVTIFPKSMNESLDEAGPGMNYRMGRGWFILPATVALYGKKVVDIKTAASEWAPHEETILVCSKDENGRQRTLFLASSGPGTGFKVGETRECFHDQTHASKGMYTVQNIVTFKDGEIISKANDISLNVKASLAVFK